MKAREYTAPLGILAAGVIGISLICSVSSMAMGDINRYISITLEPISIVDLAVANFRTAAALTEQIVTVFVPTETLVPTGTPLPASLTPVPTETQRLFVTITPTFTRRARATLTSVIPPSRTPTSRLPTRTPTVVPSRTRTPTPRPTFTNTPFPTDTTIPPTNPPTDTPLPPDTDTPQPPDTDTPQPPATDTSAPPTSANPVFVHSPTPEP